jgi:hypothetical protein
MRTLYKKWLAAIWTLIAVLFAFGMFAGGDTSIVAGLAFVIWTAPFGLLWQFFFYESALAFVPARIADPLGAIAVVALAHAFWFLLVPRLFAAGNRSRDNCK